MTSTHTYTRTHTHAAVLVEVDDTAIEALMPELATTKEVAAGIAGFIERAVSNAIEEAFDNLGHPRGIADRHPVAVVFMRDRDRSLIRFRNRDGAEELDSKAARDAIEVLQWGELVSRKHDSA